MNIFTFFGILSLFCGRLAKCGEIRVINNCQTNLWIGNRGGNRGGFLIGNGQQGSVHINNGRVWAQTGCNSGGGGCDTGDDIVTLAEVHWDGNGHSWYDISQVDGVNLPMTIRPFSNTGGRCETVGCNYDMNGRCPGENRVHRNGRLVSCKNNNRDAITNYSRSVKDQCPNVYTWSKDDHAGMRDCRPGNNGFDVIFC